MTNEENNHEIIDQYLAGTLPDNLVREVEARLTADREFRHAVALRRDIIRAVRDKERESLRNQLSELFASERVPVAESVTADPPTDQEVKVVPLRRRLWIPAVAASLFVVLAASVVWYFATDNDPTYADYALVQTPRGGVVPASVPDSIPLRIFTDREPYDFHYQLGDALTLYGEFQRDDLSVLYEPNRTGYLLVIDGRVYPLTISSEIRPLIAEE